MLWERLIGSIQCGNTCIYSVSHVLLIVYYNNTTGWLYNSNSHKPNPVLYGSHVTAAHMYVIVLNMSYPKTFQGTLFYLVLHDCYLVAPPPLIFLS